VDGEDVRVVQLCNRLGLTLEPGETVGVLCHSLMDHLYRHIAVKPLVTGAVDLSHPALADLLDDAVMAEGGADEVLHCLGSCGAMLSQLGGG